MFIIKWIKRIWFKLTKDILILLDRCPYCWKVFEKAFIDDGEGLKSSSICVNRHYAIKITFIFENTYDDGTFIDGKQTIKVEHLANDGKEMHLLEPFISYIPTEEENG